ncbi:MAG: DUF4364 family protein [Clostridia bacterium]|jgi:predicted transcriptional regulator
MSHDGIKELAENKLILLYIFGKINIPVSNIQITKIILENKYMNYFLLQQYLNELCENNHLLCEKKEDKIFYSLTDSGKQTLEYLSNLIPFGIRKNIDSNMVSEKKKIRNEISITADFTPVNENEFVVTCRVDEGSFNLVELKITVGSKNDAREICNNWKKNSQLIYPEILESISKKRE